MVSKKTAADEKVVATSGDAKLVLQTETDANDKPQKAGERGPASALEGGAGSPGNTPLSGDAGTDDKGAMEYSVQKHSDEGGLEVVYVTAISGDEAAQKVLASAKYRGTSIRGVTPASDPDANSLGGERDAAIMYQNAENGGGVINTLGTEANAETVAELAKADVKELGE